MIPPAQRWRTAWVLGLVLMIGAARAGAAVPAALTADSVQQLVVVEDNAQFLTQVALMAGQVPQIKTLTSDQQSALLQGSWSDVQTVAPALVNAQVVANAVSTRKTVAQQLNNQYNALNADITKLGVAVTANPLSAATQKAFQKMGQDAQTLVTGIGRDYLLLPVSQRPVALSLLPAAGQARTFAANATVKFVLSGPKAAITSANGTWAMTSGRQDATQPPLSTPFTKGAVTGSSGSARQSVQARSTAFGAWTYIYYQYGTRRPTLLLLNLGGLTGGNTTGGNTTGGSLGVGAISVSGGTLDFDSSGTLTLTGTNTYTGSTTINGGTLSLSSLGSSNVTLNGGGTLDFNSLSSLGSGGAITFNGGTLQWASGNLSDISNQTITINGNATLNPNGNNVTLTSPIGGNGAGGLTLNGNGTLTLTANATYTGNTTVNAGVLRVTSLDFPPGNIFVLGTGTFEYQPDGNDSLTVSAVPVDGSAFPWGDTTYEVDGQSDGSWVLPALSAQIVAVTGGYEIVEWAGASSGSGGLDVGGATFTMLGNFGSGTLNPSGGTSGLSGTNGILVNGTAFITNPLTLGPSPATTNFTVSITTGHSLTISGNIGEAAGSIGTLTLGGNGTLILSGNNTYTGNTTINGGTLSYTNASLPPGNIVVQGTGIFEYQPDANDSLVVNAAPADGREYVWGNTTYEAYVGGLGMWVLPTLGKQIVAVTGGYEILPWVAPENQNTTTADGIWYPADPAQTQDVMDPQIALYAQELAATDPQTALEWAAMITDGWMRDHVMAAIESQIAAAGP